jgi:hypothetical protein
MGFHAVKLSQNEAFHFLYHMNIIIHTQIQLMRGKKKLNCQGDHYHATKMDYYVGLSLVL